MEAKDIAHLESSYRERGWLVYTLTQTEPLHEARNRLLEELRRLTQRPDIRLENYHALAQEDTEHLRLQLAITDFFRHNRLGARIIQGEIEFFRTLLGPDLDIQSQPYLRITRPGKTDDTIGLHRDTFYGLTAFELAVVIPFVDLEEKATLSLIPGSHVQPESGYPTTQISHPTVKKGSPVHKLGFAYAPKIIDPSSLKNLTPIPLRFGEALMFSSAIVHGGSQNLSGTSRWSSDIRVKNALAPVDTTRRPDYYEPLLRSCVTEAGYRYLKANETPNAQGTEASTQALDERATRPS